MRLANAELFLYLLVEHALRVRHDLRREVHGGLRVHAFRLVDQRELVALHFGHERDFVALHRDFVGVNLLLALGGEISAASHRQRIRDESRDASDDHGMVLRRDRRADHARNQAKVCRQSVVESIHEVPEDSAGLRLVPGLPGLA